VPPFLTECAAQAKTVEDAVLDAIARDVVLVPHFASVPAANEGHTGVKDKHENERPHRSDPAINDVHGHRAHPRQEVEKEISSELPEF